MHVRTRPFDGQRVLVTPADAAELERQWNAFYEFKWTLNRMSDLFPELLPIFEDLHTGRRGQTPIDWAELERIVSRPIGPYMLPPLDRWIPARPHDKAD